MKHRIMVPAGARGNVTFIAPEGEYSLEDKVLELDFNGTKKVCRSARPGRRGLLLLAHPHRTCPTAPSLPSSLPSESWTSCAGGLRMATTDDRRLPCACR